MGCPNQPLWHCNTPPLGPEREKVLTTVKEARMGKALSRLVVRGQSPEETSEGSGGWIFIFTAVHWAKKGKKGQRQGCVDGGKWPAHNNSKSYSLYTTTFCAKKTGME